MCATASLSAIAEVAGVSKQVVSQWRKGQKSPGPPARAKLERAYGISVASWGQVPQGVAVGRARPPSSAADEDEGADTLTTMAGVEALLREIRDARSAPEDGLPLTAAERVKLADAETRLLSLKHRLEKEQELLQDRIVRQHPFWGRLKAAIGDTLLRWPEAARAVAQALKELGE